jgi:hypothetical protein
MGLIPKEARDQPESLPGANCAQDHARNNGIMNPWMRRVCARLSERLEFWEQVALPLQD